MQTAPLADGEAERAVVRSEDLAARRVDDRPVLRAEPAGEEAARVTVGDEADVVRVGLVGDGEPARGRLGANLGPSSSRRAGTSRVASCSAVSTART